MEQEIWSTVKSYDGHYMVSNSGRVKSLKRMAWNGYGWHELPERILKERLNKKGYAIVTFWLNGKKRDFSVHYLVCTAFHGERPGETYEVDHIDGNPRNNRSSNLRWVTHKDNMNNPVSKVRFLKAYDLIKRPVSQHTKTGEFIAVYDSITSASLATGVNVGNIGSCVAGNKKHRTAGGYIWKYADKNKT